MQSSHTRDLVVGLFVLAGAAAVAYLSLQIGGLSLEDEGGLELFATFDDIGGLSPRAPVRIAGVRVGEVERIALDEDLRARVTLDLRPDLALSVDTEAAIRTAGLLGDQFVALEPGAEDETLTSGEDFSFTRSAVNLDKLLGTVVHGSAFSDEQD